MEWLAVSACELVFSFCILWGHTHHAVDPIPEISPAWKLEERWYKSNGKNVLVVKTSHERFERLTPPDNWRINVGKNCFHFLNPDDSWQLEERKTIFRAPPIIFLLFFGLLKSLSLYLGVAEAGEQMQVHLAAKRANTEKSTFFRLACFGNPGESSGLHFSANYLGCLLFRNHPLATKPVKEGQMHMHCILGFSCGYIFRKLKNHRAVVTILMIIPVDVAG